MLVDNDTNMKGLKFSSLVPLALTCAQLSSSSLWCVGTHPLPKSCLSCVQNEPSLCLVSKVYTVTSSEVLSLYVYRTSLSCVLPRRVYKL